MRHISIVYLIGIGITTGIVNGLLGIGGGTILIPAMVFLLGVSQHQAHGTSLAIILPTTLASCFVYWHNNDINLMMAVQVAAGGIVGGYLGAKLMNHLSGKRLRQFFGVFMFLAGLRMMF